MKFTDLKKSIEQDGLAPIYLLEGEELYFRDKGLEMLKNRIAEPTFNFVAFDGADLKGNRMSAVADAVCALPFFSEKRMVLLREFYPTEKEYAQYLKGLFENPVDTTVLVISNGGENKPKSGGVDWKKKPNVLTVGCKRAEEEDIVKWIFLTFRRAGIACGTDVCNRIKEYCVSDMARIARETEKLICYAGTDGAIDMRTVDQLVYRDSEYKIYELTQAAARKDYSAFMRIMDDMVGKGYDEVSFLSALCAHFRTLYEVAVFKGSDRAAAEKLAMKEYAVKKSREQARRFPVDTLGGLYADLFEASANARAGEITFPAALKTVVAKIFFKSYGKTV